MEGRISSLLFPLLLVDPGPIWTHVCCVSAGFGGVDLLNTVFAFISYCVHARRMVSSADGAPGEEGGLSLLSVSLAARDSTVCLDAERGLWDGMEMIEFLEGWEKGVAIVTDSHSFL
ncbi:hypothetical protein BDY17DRAFT_132943 [Neohortaea acidophila]|uniref:Uncharacterized protein n=1 Tax=Neohortaea acidophila TaxID=245834 RepID=A0A6A6PYW2_9PEZI|nr:uncharacterized protein BDY17DRAFT_132943 [Neohortaea acidophila]KAF2484653.1 hypothetical protein BDY17DRAFT_132943 [Neohortaea acidophila]